MFRKVVGVRVGVVSVGTPAALEELDREVIEGRHSGRGNRRSSREEDVMVAGAKPDPGGAYPTLS